MLDLGAQFIQGTEPQLQVADVALPEELGGQPQQPVHRRQLGAGGTALLTQQQGPTLHPLQANPQHTSCHQNSADLQQQPQVAVGQRLVGDHRVEGGCEQPQQGGKQHHGNTDAEATTEQPQAGAGERSGGTHAKNPAGRPHIAADGQQKSKAHPDQQAADHVEAGLAWFAVGKAQQPEGTEVPLLQSGADAQHPWGEVAQLAPGLRQGHRPGHSGRNPQLIALGR